MPESWRWKTRRVWMLWSLAALSVAMLLPGIAFAAPRIEDLPAWAQVTRPPARKALVIGVGEYDQATQLSTPVHDAALMASTLRSLDFELPDDRVIRSRVDRRALLQAIRAFAGSLGEGDLAFVYFSGHGVEREGINYLVPSDGASLTDEPGHAYVTLDYLLEQLERTGVATAIIILDACRTDPFVGVEPESRDVLNLGASRQVTAVTQMTETGTLAAAAQANVPMQPHAAAQRAGLAQLDRNPMAVLVAYAAQPRQAAFSLWLGEEPRLGSIYTRTVTHRLRQLRQHPVKEVLAVAEGDVFTTTSRLQKPFQHPFAFGSLPLSASPNLRALEMETWALSVADAPPAQQIDMLRAFIHLYPASDYAFAARRRLAQLSASQAAPVRMAEAPSATEPNETALALVGRLQSVASSEGGSAMAGANIDLPLLSRWSNSLRDRIGTIRTGQQVRIVDLHRNGKAVRVLTESGQVGYVGHIDLLRPAQVQETAELSFDGTGAFANVADWSALTALRPMLARPSTAVKIRTGLPASSEATAEQVAHIRALRIRQAIIMQGVDPQRITMSPGDRELGGNSAEISVFKAGN